MPSMGDPASYTQSWNAYHLLSEYFNLDPEAGGTGPRGGNAKYIRVPCRLTTIDVLQV